MTTTPPLFCESSCPREKDKLFRALSDQRRRFALQFLQQQQAATISEIADEIARKEDDGSDSDPPSDAVRSDLYHCHIPILAEADLVHYQEERDVVAISERGTNANSFISGSHFSFRLL